MPRASACADVAARALAVRSRTRPACAGSGRGSRARRRGSAALGASSAWLDLGRRSSSARRPRRPRRRAPARRVAVARPPARRSACGSSTASPDCLLGRRHRLALVHDLGVDDVLLVGRASPSPSARRRRCAGRRLLLLGALVHRLGDLVEGRLQRLGLGVDLARVLGAQRLADLLDRGLDLRLRGLVDLLAELLELALGLVGGVLGVVAGLGELARRAVLLGVRLGVAGPCA